MAENIIREDIIKIGYDVDTSGLDKAKQTTQQWHQSFSNNINSMKNANTQFADSFEKVRQQLNIIEKTKSFADLKDDIETGGYALEVIKDKFSDIASTAKSVGKKISHPFKTLDEAVLGVQMSVARTSNDLKKLASVKVNSIIKKTKELATTLTDGERGAKGFVNLLKNIGKASIGNAVNGFSKLKTKLTENVSKAKDFLSNLKKIDNEKLTKLKSELDSVKTKLNTIAGKAGKGVVNGIKNIGKIAVGTGVAVGGILGKGVAYNSEIEQYKTSFGVMTGSAEKATKVVATLQEMGAKTPFEMTDLAETTQLLMNYGLTADEAINRMTMLGDISQGNADKMNRISMAYGQMSSAGKVQLEDVKQMIEAGFNPLQEISQTTGESMSSLYDRISKGKISVDEITQSMVRSTSKGGKYFGSMEAQSKTASGQFSTFKDNINQFLGQLAGGLSNSITGNLLPKVNDFIGKLSTAFAKGGISGMLSEMGVVGEAIQKVIDKVNDLKNNSQAMDTIKTIFNDIKSAISPMITDISDLVVKFLDFIGTESNLNAIKNAWDSIKSAIKFVWDIAVTAIGWIIDNLDWLAPIILGVVTFFTALVGVINLISTAITVWQTIQTVMNLTLWASPITWIVLAIVALIAIIVVCIVYWDEIKEIAVKCWEKIKGVWATVAEWFSTNVIQPVVNFFKGLWDKIVTVFNTVVNWIKENFMSIITFIINPFAGVFAYLYEHCEGFRNIVNNVVTAVKNYFVNLWYFLVGLAVTIWEGIKAVIVPIALWIYNNIILPVINFFIGLWNRLVSIVTSIVSGIKMIWNTVTTWIYTYIITPIINFFINLWNRLISIVTSIVNGIKAIWGTISSWVSTYVITPVVTFFTNLWTRITEIVNNVWNTICTIWGAISSWVSTNIIEPIKGFFSGLWDNITQTVSSVKEGIISAFTSAFDKVKEIWNGITEFFSGLWNGIKDTVNKLIGKGKEALGVSDDVKSKDSKAKHAWGGLMTTRHEGVVAEAGAEMIIPLSHDKRKYATDLWQQTGNMLGVGAEVPTIQTAIPTYSPESDRGDIYNNAYSEGDKYEFTVNINVDGNGKSDRELASLIKSKVKEGIQEAQDSFRRKNPRLTEV